MSEGVSVTEPPVTRHRFTVEEFHLMGEAGIFHEDDRVELVEGEVVEMSPIGWRHVWSVDALTNLLAGWSAGRYVVSVQNPLVLGEYGEYLPDVMLLRKDRPQGRLPAAEDVLLVIEIAYASLRYDREVKLPLYASSGIPEAWLVNLREEVVEVHSSPGPEGYGALSRTRRGEEVGSATIEGLTFGAAEILPLPE